MHNNTFIILTSQSLNKKEFILLYPDGHCAGEIGGLVKYNIEGRYRQKSPDYCQK